LEKIEGEREKNPSVPSSKSDKLEFVTEFYVRPERLLVGSWAAATRTLQSWGQVTWHPYVPSEEGPTAKQEFVSELKYTWRPIHEQLRPSSHDKVFPSPSPEIHRK